MFYTVYKTTHLSSGKTYIGMHATENPDDSYLGSGNLISRAIKKHGREAFSKEVLFVFATPEEMIAKEKELVTEEFISRDETYNLNVGGDGGWFRANQVYTSAMRTSSLRKALDKQKELVQGDSPFRSARREQGARLTKWCQEHGYSFKADLWVGRHHSADTKAKMSAAKKGRFDGELNPNFGRRWVHLGEKVLQVQEADMEAYLNSGWQAGRKPRKEKEGKPRACKGPPPKLGPSEAEEIRHLYATGFHTQNEIAKTFGVSQKTVSYVIRGLAWAMHNAGV